MDKDGLWVIVRIDGKIAAVSTDYRELHTITGFLATQKVPGFSEISVTTVGFEDVWKLRQEVSWDDFLLFGTDFQKKVWKSLFGLTHQDDGQVSEIPKLMSYSDFASCCGSPAGVRAVAHAVGLNPVAVLIPCHLIVPKEAIDRIEAIRTKAESTIFKGEDLCLDKILGDPSIDFGEYGLGRQLKRKLILLENCSRG
ncbi:MAG: methylated-DNA--[protein]-cysteine S-methyltransferase [Candidatus Cryptobacteroides sp.]